MTWTLDAALATALAQHPLVDAARAQVTAAEGRKMTATKAPNPIGTFWIENARFPGQDPLPLAAETSVYATMPLDPFIQRSQRTTTAAADIRAAEADVTVAERRIAADVVHAFYRVALAQASVAAVRETQVATEQFVEYVRSRVAQGATPESELIRVEVEHDRLQSSAALAEVERLRATSALRAFLGDGAPPDSLRVVAPDWSSPVVRLPPVTVFTTHALAARPELVARRARIEAATSAVAVERSLVIRELGATFGVKRTAGINAMVAGLSATVPIFDQNKGAIQRATGERIAAEQETRWLERAITSEVDAEYQAATVLMPYVATVQPPSILRAEEARRIAVAAYQEGAVSLLQVLDASRALSDARLASAQAVAATGESLFSLGVAAGYDVQTAARLGRDAVLLPNDQPVSGGTR